MADLTKLKRRNTLGVPPAPEEASPNLTAPEIAPVHPHTAEAQASSTSRLTSREQGRIDGRTLRKTGRTLQFATRVSEDFDDRLRHIAQRDGIKLVEVLERALDVYEASRNEIAAR
jgi:hypothetical protein